MKIVYQALVVLLCLFVLASANTIIFKQTQTSLALFGLLGMILLFLEKPLFGKRGSADGTPLPYSSPWRIPDYLAILLSILAFGYVFVQTEDRFSQFWIDGIMLGNRAGEEQAFEFVIAGIGLVLVLEATRRAIGWTLPILCVVFLAYAYYGQRMPDWLFPHRGQTWEELSKVSFLQTSGVFGIALNIMFKFVFLFVLFGALLEQTGATGYIIRLARRMFRSSTGGPAKVAVVSSGLMGSLSGSAVANTATTGTFTIPLMKSSGFDDDSAGGVEAAASSGGALMPPIMGAGAYMMLELVEPSVSYLQIIQAALIPALLYYIALLTTVHFHAIRIGAGSESQKQMDSKKDNQEYSLLQGMVFFGSFLILLALLFIGYSAFLAVSWSMLGVVVLSQFSDSTRLTPGRILKACEVATRGGVALIVAASCVGVIMAIVNTTGLQAALPAKIQSLGGDNAIAALLLLMTSTIILGMGLPSAVCYLLMATILGSVFLTLQTAPLAAHLFVFYFGMMSMVTPPVALAAYAAAGIAKGDVIKTSFAAFRFALAGFALPFAFVLKPELVMLTPDNEPAAVLTIVLTTLAILVAIYAMAGAIAGQLTGPLNTLWRATLLPLSLVVFFTRASGPQLFIQWAVVGILVVLLILEWRLHRQRDGSPGPATAA